LGEANAVQHAQRAGGEAGKVTRERLDGDHHRLAVTLDDNETHLPPPAEPSIRRERDAVLRAFRQTVAVAGFLRGEHGVDLTAPEAGYAGG
jgi:hypothetical protein